MSLGSLPTELIENIATHLDLSTSCSIRLVSSSLNQQSLHPFKDRFYSTRTVQWTKPGLDTLVEVTRHGVFGTALQHLMIDATPWHSISLWQLCKRISEADAIFSDPNSLLFKSELQEKYIADEKEAKDLTTFFNETRYDQKCLRTVFEKMQSLESVVFEYEGLDKKYGKFGRRYCESSQHEMSRPFVSVMAAIAASGIHVKGISIHPINKYGAVSIGRLESLAPSLRNFDAAFEKLELLKLNLRDWRYPDAGFELESTKAPFVVRFLNKAQGVRHLDLSCYSSLEDDLFGEMAHHFSFSYLETCTLSLFRLHNSTDLTTFLAASFSTLRYLHLSHVVLRDENFTWPDLLRHIASSDEVLHGLETLELAHLFTRTGSRLHFGDSGMTTRLVVGTEGFLGSWREELLTFLDDLTEGTSGPAWNMAVIAYPFTGMQI